MKATYEKMYESLDYGPIATARGLAAAQHVEILFPKQKKILCVGAGNSYEAVFLASRGYDVTVVDFIKAPIRNPKFKQIVGDATNLTFKDDEFEVVMCCECLEHIPETHIDKFILGLKRVGTFFYFTIDDQDDPPYCSHLCLHDPVWWVKRFKTLGFSGHMFNPNRYFAKVGEKIVEWGFSNHGANFYGNKVL